MPETTLFPVRQSGVTHAAFLLNEPRDEWSTRCGRRIKHPEDVQLLHGRAEVECPACEAQIQRGLQVRAAGSQR